MKRVLVAALAVAVFAGDSVACPGLLGRLRARVQARSGGGCFGGGGGGFFQQGDQGGGGDFQGQDQTQPNDDVVRYSLGYTTTPPVYAASPVSNCPCVGIPAPQVAPGFVVPVQMAATFNPPVQFVPAAVAPPAPLPPAASPPPPRTASAEPPSVAPKAAVADDVLTPPGVGIAAVEKRTTALEAEVAALKAQVAALLGQQTTRSTVYLSGTAPVPAASPAVQYQTIPVQNVPVYQNRLGFPVTRVPMLGGTVCGPNGCYRQ